MKIGGKLDTKTISLVVAFAGLAIVMNPAISGLGFPFPPVPGLIFNFWELVVVIAFLLTGFKGGLAVAFLNAVFLLAVYPGPSRAIYPLTNTIAVSSMMVGMYSANKIMTRKANGENKASTYKTVSYYTIFAMLLRIAVMAPIMYLLLFLVGMSTLAVVATILPLQAVYNIIMALYIVPFGYFLANTVNRNFKFTSELVE
jgi:riboflavin transporter FmnP